MKKEDETMNDLQKQFLDDYSIIVHSYQDNQISNIPDFLKKVDKITDLKKDSIIQLLDTDYICGNNHLYQGIVQAFKSFNEKQNFAKDKGLEICVRLSAQKQISEALKILGIKKEGNITVLYINTSDEQITEMEKLLNARNDDLLEEYDSDKIINTYDLINDENLIDNLNEKIALLSIKT
ncbi:KEOPS complex subunit Cgi121 [Methanosphaera sp.]